MVVALDFLNERWRLPLERALHHRLCVVRVRDGPTMQALPRINDAVLALLAFLVWYPAGAWSLVKRSQRWWWKQAMGVKAPVVTVVGRQLAAVRALPPAQTTVRKQELRQPHPARSCSFVETLRSALVERVPWPRRLGPADTSRGNQVPKIVEEL
jgi:hypothetical protein